ncbi:MAG: hypothetical protein HZB20_05570 [Chloroflexi bacterium]|nr:hypothetical protein [Chloroflexota bacterium]
MKGHDDFNGLWLHLICCGGPILVFALIGLLPALIAFALTYKVWALAAGAGLTLAGALVWWRRVRRVSQINRACRPDQIKPARARQP